jgi:hypothetical protein
MVGLVGHRAGGWLILVRFAWSAEILFAPYALFWLWVIIVCIELICRKIALPEEAAA